MTLLRRVAPARPDDARAALRAAQAARDQAVKAAQRAAGAAERARQAVAAAEASLAVHAATDARVASYHADRLRAGGDGPTGLPPDLAEARRQQAIARQQRADAGAAAALLEAEAVQAQQAADEAEAAVRLGVDNILQLEARRVLDEMRAMEVRAAELRMMVGAFLDGRTGNDSRISDNDLATLPFDGLHQPMIALAQHRGIRPDPAAAAWATFSNQLLGDPAATFEPSR